MKNDNTIFSVSYPDAKAIIVCGDIHGDFNLLVNKLCVQYHIKDTVLIVAGDCGFGFEQKGYYENIVRKNAKRLNEANNWIVFVRGNHDNPAYFDGLTFNHKRMIAVPDYTIINACNINVLCIGGAISVDRGYRIKEWNKKQRNHHKHSTNEDDLLSRNIYWENELPIFDANKLHEIKQMCKVNVVVTHTAPSFCELLMKGGLDYWANDDLQLLEDVKTEREVMTRIFQYLIDDKHPLSHWCYGHFHQSWHSPINGIMFTMLDIMEFKEIYT